MLEFVAAEKLVFVALRAVRAFKAADEQHRNTQGDQDGQHTRVRADELSK